MRSKTEELLYMLLWASQIASRPTFRNLTDSFEAWAYRSGFHRQLAELEKKELLETQGHSAGDRVHRLTEAGRLLALGGRDPVACWKRRWDGKWRMILFDVPQKQASDRVRLRRSLADRKFGYLQNSVWITPDPLNRERDALGAGPVDVGSLILLEARPCAGERDAEIVAGAWNFNAINEGYNRHTQVLQSLPEQATTDDVAGKRLHRWFCEERQAWNYVMSLDPLLPKRLHPADYRGPKAWQHRLEKMAEAGRKMRCFQKGV